MLGVRLVDLSEVGGHPLGREPLLDRRGEAGADQLADVGLGVVAVPAAEHHLRLELGALAGGVAQGLLPRLGDDLALVARELDEDPDLAILGRQGRAELGDELGRVGPRLLLLLLLLVPVPTQEDEERAAAIFCLSAAFASRSTLFFSCSAFVKCAAPPPQATAATEYVEMSASAFVAAFFTVAFVSTFFVASFGLVRASPPPARDPE